MSVISGRRVCGTAKLPEMLGVSVTKVAEMIREALAQIGRARDNV